MWAGPTLVTTRTSGVHAACQWGIRQQYSIRRGTAPGEIGTTPRKVKSERSPEVGTAPPNDSCPAAPCEGKFGEGQGAGAHWPSPQIGEG